MKIAGYFIDVIAADPGASKVADEWRRCGRGVFGGRFLDRLFALPFALGAQFGIDCYAAVRAESSLPVICCA